MKVRPVNDRILVRPFKAPEKRGIFWIPEQAQGEVQVGIVEAVGPGKGFEGPGLSVTEERRSRNLGPRAWVSPLGGNPDTAATGGLAAQMQAQAQAEEEPLWTPFHRTRHERAPLQVHVGDIVAFGRYSGAKVEVGTRELFLLREDELLAVVEDLPADWIAENEEKVEAERGDVEIRDLSGAGDFSSESQGVGASHAADVVDEASAPPAIIRVD
jgi:co-chaperonin GroES (HSP10)